MKKNTGWTHFYEKKPVNFLRVMKLLFVLMTVTSLSVASGRRGSATDQRPLSWQAAAETAPHDESKGTTP